MNAWKARVGDGISVAFGLFDFARSAAGGRVLMYHSVGGEVAGDRRGLYSIAPERFAEHVRCLGGSQDAVAFDTAVVTGRGLAITFDDGYRDTLTIAAPLLMEAKLPFTVFVTPAFVMSGLPQYLSRADLQELSRLPGVTIGGHGYSHRRLVGCGDEDLEHELAVSRSWLEDVLGLPVTTMSYPHGSVDARVRVAVAKAGYTIAAGSRFGIYRLEGDPLSVPRTDIWATDDNARFRSKIAGHWDWMGLRA